MIEPFEDRQVRRTDAHGRQVISYGVSSYGYDMRVAPRVQDLHQRALGDRRPEGLRRQELRRVRGGGLHRAAEQLRAGPLGRVLPDPAQRADDLRGQVHLRALRHHHQRHALRAGVGGVRHARNQQHHAAARPGLRQRGHLPGALLRGRRGRRVRGELQGQGRASTRGRWASPCPGSSAPAAGAPPARPPPAAPPGRSGRPGRSPLRSPTPRSRP